MPDYTDDDTTDSISVPGPQSDVTERRPYLLVMAAQGHAQVGKMVRLEAAELTIGRGNSADLAFADDGISRMHAKVVRENDSHKVVDLGSRNGTFVNGQRVDSAVLKDGDRVQLGVATVLLYALKDRLEARFQQSLYESATRDPLTKLLNRRAALDLLAAELAFSSRHGAPLSIVSLDIDHFKQVNDSYGHLVGDQVLAHVSQMLAATLRTEDTLARVGGEEFLLILRGTHLAAALQCAERCRRVIESSPMSFRDVSLKVTVSAGVAALSNETVVGLLEAADRALYDAKARGRNQVYPRS